MTPIRLFRTPSLPRVALAAATALCLPLLGCGGGPAAGPEATSGTALATPSATGATSADPMTTPTVDGRYAVDGKRSLALSCWGTGIPVIVYDAGTGTAGLELWPSRPVLTELARTNEVCTYDRAGLGESDPAPNHRRVLDDAARDLHRLLLAAQVAGPYVLVGASGGGFDVYQHAGRYPTEVAGLMMLDVPRGQAKMSAEDVKALAWNAPDNPEHMDYVAIEHQMAVRRLPIPAIPVTVIAAKSGVSEEPSEQRIWLAGSSHPTYIPLAGGHDIYDDDPDGVVAQLQTLIELT